jgi:hypothetical protein
MGFRTSALEGISLHRNPPLVTHHQSPVCLSFLTDRIVIDLEIERFVVQPFDGNTFDRVCCVQPTFRTCSNPKPFIPVFDFLWYGMCVRFSDFKYNYDNYAPHSALAQAKIRFNPILRKLDAECEFEIAKTVQEPVMWAGADFHLNLVCCRILKIQLTPDIF